MFGIAVSSPCIRTELCSISLREWKKMCRICNVALIISVFITFFFNSTGNRLQRSRARLTRILLFRVSNDHYFTRNYLIHGFLFISYEKYSTTKPSMTVLSTTKCTAKYITPFKKVGPWPPFVLSIAFSYSTKIVSR